MSQNSLILPTTGTVSGLQMTQNINNALDTLNTLASGAGAPSSPEAGQLWHDITTNTLKIRDQANANWVVIGTVDETNKLFYAAQRRQILTANTTYYVSPTGSDSNNGLSSGSPFLTIQKAITVVQALDLNGYTVTIQLADGTYTAGATIAGNFTGGGAVVINGNSTTPSNVVISVTSSQCLYAYNGAIITIQNLKVQTTTGGDAIRGTSKAIIYYNNIVFGNCAAVHLNALDGAILYCSGNYSIVGGASVHQYCEFGGEHRANGITITLTGTPNITNFAQCIAGIMQLASNTYSGSATGTRYNASLNGVIYTAGGASYFPGSIAGTTATGGQYA